MLALASNLSGTTASKILYSSLVDQLQRKWISAVLCLWESPIKHVSNTHPAQMYLTVSIGPSHMESSTEFIKKFFFRWSPQFSASEPPNKNLPNRDMSFQWLTTLLLSQKTTLGNTWTQSLITNFLRFTLFSSYNWDHHKQDLLITTNKISHCLLQLQIIKS